MADGDFEGLDHKEPFADGELQQLAEQLEDVYGTHLKLPDWDSLEGKAEEEAAEEEYLQKWAEWVVPKLTFKRRKGSVPGKTVREKAEEELKKKDPLYAHISETIDMSV